MFRPTNFFPLTILAMIVIAVILEAYIKFATKSSETKNVEGYEEPEILCKEIESKSECFEYIDEKPVGFKKFNDPNCQCKDPIGYEKELIYEFVKTSIEDVGTKSLEAVQNLSDNISKIKIKW